MSKPLIETQVITIPKLARASETESKESVLGVRGRRWARRSCRQGIGAMMRQLVEKGHGTGWNFSYRWSRLKEQLQAARAR
jgi:hypothetical protein